MTSIPRHEASDVETTMFIRPRNPDDHRQFEWLFPQCDPLFIYSREQDIEVAVGDQIMSVPMEVDYVRWEVPIEVAEQLGWAKGCTCCGDDSDLVHTMDGILIDTAWHEVHWWFDNGEKASPRTIKRERRQITQ